MEFTKEDIDKLTKLAEDGDFEAQKTLALFYKEKDDLEQSYRWVNKIMERKSDNKDFQETIKLAQMSIEELKEPAEKGNIQAQVFLGTRLANEKKYEEAFEWFKKAALQEDRDAIYFIGTFYADGLYVEKSMEKAYMLIKTAADKGQEKAIETLKSPRFKEFMKITEEDIARLTKMAESGDMDAQITLADIYYARKDIEQANKWYAKSAEQQTDNKELQEIVRLSKLDKEGLTKEAENGSIIAQSFLGTMLANEKNYPEAFKWTEKAAEQGDREAQYLLGAMYMEGLSVEKNTEEAWKWIKKSAERGFPRAIEVLKRAMN